MIRPRFAVALARAAVMDAARLMVTVGQWMILDPCLCRALGHNTQALYDAEHTRVATICLRCGRDFQEA